MQDQKPSKVVHLATRTGSAALAVFCLLALAVPQAWAQSFRVQCPTNTITHPAALNNNNVEPAYTGPTALSSTVSAEGGTAVNGYLAPTSKVNGAIKCQQISGGDGYASMADGTQIYLFSFGPLSGVVDLANGKPATQFPAVFNAPYILPNSGPVLPNSVPQVAATVPLPPGYPAVAAGSVMFNGAVGLAPNVTNTASIFQISEGAIAGFPSDANTVLVVLNAPSTFKVGDQVIIGQGTGTDLAGYTGTYMVTGINPPTGLADMPAAFAFTYELPTSVTGLATVQASPDATASASPGVDGHVDPREIMDVAVMNGNIPAPLMAIDEDDEYFLTLSNVGMIMRPDLFEQHTVHFHGYPNASPFYDGVPGASVAITIGASFSYYYLAPDAGTYFWHCHITPPEHLQMGMVGQLYVRPRQNRVPSGTSLYASLQLQQGDLRTACNSASDITCSNPLPAGGDNGTTGGFQTSTGTPTKMYVYNDGDGSTYYDVEYPIQMHSFDPNFHFVGMTFNPEPFADMKDKYFLLNGRSYPDTVNTGTLANPNVVSPDGTALTAITTPSSDGVPHFSQPLNTLINIPQGGRALLRVSELNVSEYHTLTTMGVPMIVVGWNAKLLRDQAGNNMAYQTNSFTMGGGESADVILDTCLARSNAKDPSSACTTPIPKGTYYLYSSNLDHLSNDAENFGGFMTEVHVN